MSLLYLVPTPIGNLSDISDRCRQTLAEADFIAAEDTRVTLKLLNYLEIKKLLVSYYEHNKETSGPRILERILAGETCALVSDAGSPAISDPGEDLVRLCADAGVTVVTNDEVDTEAFKALTPKLMERQGVSPEEYQKVVAAVSGNE